MLNPRTAMFNLILDMVSPLGKDQICVLSGGQRSKFDIACLVVKGQSLISL